MKLFFCPDCWALVPLATNRMRFCSCRKSYGRYKSSKFNSTRAEMGGKAIPMGVDNRDLLRYLLCGSQQAPVLWRKEYGGDLERIADE